MLDRLSYIISYYGFYYVIESILPCTNEENDKSEEFRKLSPSKGIVAILILLVGVGVVLAVVFLTRKEEEPSKIFF